MIQMCVDFLAMLRLHLVTPGTEEHIAMLTRFILSGIRRRAASLRMIATCGSYVP